MSSESAALAGGPKTTKDNTHEVAAGQGQETSHDWTTQAAQDASRPQTTDRTKTTDQAQAPQDSSTDNEDPYSHTNRIKALTAQLDQLSAQNKKPDDVIQVGDRQVKVKDFVVEAKQTIKLEMDAAKKMAESINQPRVGEMINQNISDKNNLARQLGLDPAKITPELLQSERAKSGLNPERRQALDQLDLNLQERAALEAFRHAPAYVKLVEAEVTVKGYANTHLGLNQEVSPNEYRKAFDLVKLAGNQDRDLKATDIYQRIETSVGMTFASFQQVRSQQIIDLMTKATEAHKSGAKQTVTIDGRTMQLGEEDLLKEANRLADKINVGWVASQAMIPRNQENGAAGELMNIVYIASHARLDYVNYMAEHGDIKEAQKLFNKVKADTPELIYKEDGSHRDSSLQALDNKLTLGVNTDGADYQTAQSNFLANIEKGNINPDSKKPGQSADDNLKQMKELNRQMQREMNEANKVLQQERADLVKQQDGFTKKGNLSESDKVELERVKREIQVIDNTMAQRTAYFDRRQNLTDYMEASWNEAAENYDEAHRLYKKFGEAEKDTELKKNLGVEDKLKRTEPGFWGWWNRNLAYIAIGGSILVAAGLTVATLGIGSAAGIGLVGTAIAATAAGTGGAALTHWAIERTVNKNAGWESAWKGAKIGLMTSSMIVAPWASGARVAAGAAATEAVGGTGAALNTANAIQNTSRIMTMARSVGVGAAKIGLTPTSLATGYTVTGITEGGDYMLGLKSGKDALIDFTWKGALNSAFIGQAAKWGTPAAEAAIAQNAAKMTVPRALGLTGFNAGAGYTVSGIMEGSNYLRGQKTGGEAFRDFAVGGAVNTVTLSVLRKYGLSDTVGRAATANLQNLRYAGQAVALQESFGAAADIVGTKYIAHDILGRPAFIRENGNSVTAPLVADFYERNFGSGLNARHPGERQRFNSNLDALGNDFSATILQDQKFVDPFRVNTQGLFFNLDPNDQR